MSVVEFRRVVRGRVWHVATAATLHAGLCGEPTSREGTEYLPDRPPLGARVCPRCIAVCEVLGAVGQEHKP